jgi:hypothetical protein
MDGLSADSKSAKAASGLPKANGRFWWANVKKRRKVIGLKGKGRSVPRTGRFFVAQAVVSFNRVPDLLTALCELGLLGFSHQSFHQGLLGLNASLSHLSRWK